MAVWLFPDAAAQSTSPTPITSSQLTMTLQSTAGFGTIGALQQMGGIVMDTGNPAWNALTSNGQNPLAAPYEYVFITGNNLGTNTLNVVRGQAGTTPKNFSAGATVAATLLGEAIAAAFARVDAGPGTLTNLNGLAATAGPPTSGTWAQGALWIDAKGIPWLCTAGGTSGTWRPLGARHLWDTQTLGANAASVSVTLPTVGFSHAEFVIEYRSDQVGGNGYTEGFWRLNGDSTAAHYALERIDAFGTTLEAVQDLGTDAGIQSWIPNNDRVAGLFTLSELTLYNFLDTGKLKHAKVAWSLWAGTAFPPAASQMWTAQMHAWWNNTAAVTTASFTPVVGLLLAGTKIDTYVEV